MTIAILGAGAIGGSLAGYLIESKQDVILIDFWHGLCGTIRANFLLRNSLDLFKKWCILLVWERKNRYNFTARQSPIRFRPSITQESFFM